MELIVFQKSIIFKSAREISFFFAVFVAPARDWHYTKQTANDCYYEKLARDKHDGREKWEILFHKLIAFAALGDCRRNNAKWGTRETRTKVFLMSLGGMRQWCRRESDFWWRKHWVKRSTEGSSSPSELHLLDSLNLLNLPPPHCPTNPNLLRSPNSYLQLFPSIKAEVPTLRLRVVPPLSPFLVLRKFLKAIFRNHERARSNNKQTRRKMV